MIWQYVYDTDKSESDIVNYFKDSRLFDITNISDNRIYGTVDNKPIEYRKYGFSSMSTPMYISGSNCSYNVSIDIKEKRYRVTVSQIMFQSTTDYNSKYISTNSNSKTSLNVYAYNYNRGQFKSIFSSCGADITLATVWFNTFLITDSEPQNDNW